MENGVYKNEMRRRLHGHLLLEQSIDESEFCLFLFVQGVRIFDGFAVRLQHLAPGGFLELLFEIFDGPSEFFLLLPSGIVVLPKFFDRHRVDVLGDGTGGGFGFIG